MSGTSKTYRYGVDVAPLFPFGYGLSYGGPFKYSHLTIASVVHPCQNLSVSVSVSNTGSMDADEVVQVYASWEPDADVSAMSLRQARRWCTPRRRRQHPQRRPPAHLPRPRSKNPR